MKVRITSLAGLAGSQAPAWEPLPIKLLLVRLPFLGKQELQNTVLPSWSSHCYTQVLEARHSGRDCRNPVHREVKLRAGNYQNQTLAQRRVALHGFWIPAIPAGMTTFLARAVLCITPRAGAWEPAILLSGSCF